MKMPKTLKSYVKIYKNFLTDQFCKDVVNELTKSNWQTHAFYRADVREHISYENELSVSMDPIPQYEEINRKIWKSIERYVLKDFGYDWYNGWNGHTLARFNKYDVNTQMRIHCDHIHSMFDGQRKGVPILTVLGGLNNDYKGGELVMWEEEVIELKAGSIMVFPSNFMYPHRVDPVTEGVRYSFVSWVW